MSKSKKIRRILKRAQRGDLYCAYLIGLFYENTVQNIPIALYWYQIAAEGGQPDALDKMKEYYFDDNADTQANS